MLCHRTLDLGFGRVVTGRKASHPFSIFPRQTSRFSIFTRPYLISQYVVYKIIRRHFCEVQGLRRLICLAGVRRTPLPFRIINGSEIRRTTAVGKARNLLPPANGWLRSETRASEAVRVEPATVVGVVSRQGFVVSLLCRRFLRNSPLG